MITLIRKMLLAVAFLGALLGASATTTVAMAQEDRSTMSQDWGSSEDFQSTQERVAEQNAATQRYLLREGMIGNTTTINGDYIANTTNTGPMTSSNATNIGQYSASQLTVSGDNSMATLTTTTDQDGSAEQGATSTVNATGNTFNTTRP